MADQGLGPDSDAPEPAGAGPGPARHRQVDSDAESSRGVDCAPARHRRHFDPRERPIRGHDDSHSTGETLPMRTMSRVLLVLIVLLAWTAARNEAAGRERRRTARPGRRVARAAAIHQRRVRLGQGPEFMYVFSQGGTMTESSNYDASPPCHRHTGSGGRSGPRSSRPSTSSM